MNIKEYQLQFQKKVFRIVEKNYKGKEKQKILLIIPLICKVFKVILEDIKIKKCLDTQKKE